MVVDRLRVDAEESDRLADSLQTAFTEGEGEAVVVPVARSTLRFTERFRCPLHPEIVFATPTPQLFSFNNPYGRCPECTGFGAVLQYDDSLIVPNRARARWRRAPSTPGASRATRRAARGCTTSPARRAFRWIRPGSELPEAFRERCCTARAASRASSPS